ncbi:Multidrug resistance-associated protein 4 [Galemys pyrenaicus]|uniref:Multidrug resistance-associated protein 4 n=1 Tax=Galemys pyrenaicus TaxID=202257 RepID=A0A8J6AAG0_GALPY|nr:Multidrug resistance-associated protein 4 [Galemys pyrenaicus]
MFFAMPFAEWLNPLFKIGHKRRLEEDDMYSVLPNDRSKHLGEELQRYWDKEVLRAEKEAQTPSLTRAIIKCYWKSYLVLGIFTLIEVNALTDAEFCSKYVGWCLMTRLHLVTMGPRAVSHVVRCVTVTRVCRSSWPDVAPGHTWLLLVRSPWHLWCVPVAQPPGSEAPVVQGPASCAGFESLLRRGASGSSPDLWSLDLSGPGLCFRELYADPSDAQEGAKVVQPIFLGKIISYFENYDPADSAALREAYICAAALTTCTLFLAILHHLYFYHVQCAGMRLRVAMCHMIYRKVGGHQRQRQAPRSEPSPLWGRAVCVRHPVQSPRPARQGGLASADLRSAFSRALSVSTCVVWL